MSLPEIDISKLNSLKGAKEIIQTLMNLLEQSIKAHDQLLKQVEELKAENARLRKQSRNPRIGKGNGTGNKSNNYSSKKYLSGMNNWNKSGKKDQLGVDGHEQLPEISECSCGHRKFKVIDTWNKLIQGLIIKRNNVVYYGRTKKCLKCGQVHRSIIPDGIKGQQFSQELRSWLSVFKFQCRMSEVLINEFLSGLGIRISTGQINRIIMNNSKLLSPAYSHLVVWGVIPSCLNIFHLSLSSKMKNFKPGIPLLFLKLFKQGSIS